MDPAQVTPLSQYIVSTSPETAISNPAAPAAAPGQLNQAASPPAPGQLYRAASPPAPQSSLATCLLALLAVLVVVIIIVCCRCRHTTPPYAPVASFAGGPTAAPPAAGLASSLAARGWYLYTLPGCGFCTKQYAALGLKGAGEYPKQVECGGAQAKNQGPRPCKDIQGFPFWVNATTGATRSGLQLPPQLQEML